jgi:2-aminoethylphosphonate-pyruvate transaminase
MIKTAVIIADGIGAHFGINADLIRDGFVKVNGIPIVVQSIETLISCGIDRIIIGTGYNKEVYEELTKEYSQVVCCHNSRYAETNCLYTLWNCRGLIGNDGFLLLDSDLIYEPKAIISLLICPYSSAILATPVRNSQNYIQNSTFVDEDKNHRLVKWSKYNDELNTCIESTGIFKISNKFFKKVCREFERDIKANEHSNYESLFEKVSNDVCSIYILKSGNFKWKKIENEVDLKFVEQNFSINHKRHTYHATIKNMLKSPLVCYRNERYYQHSGAMNKEDARYLLNTLRDVYHQNGIELILAYGTLLGAVREHDFISHDPDMDTMVWSKDMQKGLDLHTELEKYGIMLYSYVLPWIFTYKYRDVTCDVDVIWDMSGLFNNRYCLIQSQHVPRSYFENLKTMEFQGEQHLVPADFEKLLVYHYGKKWRIPGGRHARLESYFFFWRYMKKIMKKVVRFVKKRCALS